jgi:predicted phage terminase large subunit-like protein
LKLKELEEAQRAQKERLFQLEKSHKFQVARDKALNDFYFFCIEVMGFKDLYEPLHRMLCDKVSNQDVIRKLIMIPRGHFKTTISSICYPAWLLARDMNERIIIASSALSKAQECLSEIVQRITDERFQYYLGDRIPHVDTWLQNTQGQIWFPRRSKFTGPTILTLGVDSAEVGKHGSRMIMDDIVGKEQVNTKPNRDKAWEWFGRQFSVLDPNCELCIVCTKWHEDDVYGRMQTDESWEKIVMKVKEPWPDGPFIFPTRFNEKTLKEIQSVQDEYTFSCFYLNEPSGAGVNPFQVGKFTFIEYPFKVEYRKDRSKEDNDYTKPWTYLLVDPAATTEGYSCPSGILLVDALSDKRLVIREAIQKKYEPDELVELIFAMVKAHKPRKVIIEAEAQQRTYHYWIRKEMFRRKMHFKIEEVKNPRNKTKYNRILALQPYLHNGDFVFQKDMPGRDALMEEFRTYPNGKTDDMICALYMAIPEVQYPPRNARRDSRKPVPIKSRLLHEMVHRKERAFGRAPRIRVGGRRGKTAERKVAQGLERLGIKGLR